MARLHSCNVLSTGAAGRKLWQFQAQGNFNLTREHTSPDGEPLPGGVAQKSWGSLWQPRLNVAWLPAESVFFRVIHLPPASNFAETLSMVELQLEKLSPIPVGQVAWSVHPLPAQSGVPDDLQTLIVVLVERKQVEDFLGELEGQGYLADRLELQALDQLSVASVTENGAWIYPGLGGPHNTALVAWWYNGKLQNLNTLTMPGTGDRAASLKEQLAQMAWAGELEGWLTSLPHWTLVADEQTAAEWEGPLKRGLDAPIQLVSPLKPVELAARTARRAVEADAKSNLVPPEYAGRYRNQFVDRLWIRGLLAVGALYVVGVLIYFGIVGVQEFRVSRVEAKVAAMGPTYTNAIQLRERYQILKTRQELKFAALDCWRKTAELLPDSAQLETFAFSDGHRLALSGTSPQDGAAD
ncbi:MAG TPA: hypothetical protein VFZ59_14225, partial [Verrucomicrobiae bacterium]|nr:hypothetical protein [Verrucomicrobiae bacterium]